MSKMKVRKDEMAAAGAGAGAPRMNASQDGRGAPQEGGGDYYDPSAAGETGAGESRAEDRAQ